MATYWHPLLAQFLEMDYGDRLIIQKELELGELPLRADLLLIRRSLEEPLPFPFCFLGQQTLVEFKGPDDTAVQADLVTLEVYGLLYQLRERFFDRQELTLWLIASRFGANLFQPKGAHLRDERDLGMGVIGGSLDGFPTFTIDLTRLPVEPATLPLLMVTKGAKEQELAEFLLEHRMEFPEYLAHFRLWHYTAFEEVLKMKQTTAEEVFAGVDFAKVARSFGLETITQMAKEFGPEALTRLAREFGPEALTRLAREFGPEVLTHLAREFGPESLAQALAALEDEQREQVLKLLKKQQRKKRQQPSGK